MQKAEAPPLPGKPSKETGSATTANDAGGSATAKEAGGPTTGKEATSQSNSTDIRNFVRFRHGVPHLQ